MPSLSYSEASRSHLDVPARETRLRGVHVGEVVAELGGLRLRFDGLEVREGGAAAAAEERRGTGSREVGQRERARRRDRRRGGRRAGHGGGRQRRWLREEQV